MEHIKFASMAPVFAVDDLQRDIAYYVEQLSFVVNWRWGAPPVRAGVSRDGFEIQLVSDGRFAPKDASVVYFQITGVDAYHRLCVQNGAIMQMPIGNRPFGMRDFRVEDLSGNVLGFSEPLPKSP